MGERVSRCVRPAATPGTLSLVFHNFQPREKILAHVNVDAECL